MQGGRDRQPEAVAGERSKAAPASVAGTPLPSPPVPRALRAAAPAQPRPFPIPAPSAEKTRVGRASWILAGFWRHPLSRPLQLLVFIVVADAPHGDGLGGVRESVQATSPLHQPVLSPAGMTKVGMEHLPGPQIVTSGAQFCPSARFRDGESEDSVRVNSSARVPPQSCCVGFQVTGRASSQQAAHLFLKKKKKN